MMTEKRYVDVLRQLEEGGLLMINESMRDDLAEELESFIEGGISVLDHSASYSAILNDQRYNIEFIIRVTRYLIINNLTDPTTQIDRTIVDRAIATTMIAMGSERIVQGMRDKATRRRS